jgi:hypothetical protein
MRYFEDKRYEELENLQLSKVAEKSENLNFLVQHEFLNHLKGMVTKSNTNATQSVNVKNEGAIRRQLYNKVKRPDQ